jgi:acyl-CoA synthetase (NDP forming)
MSPETTSGPSKAGELTTLFAPRSVAVIGASSDATRIGGRPISYYLQAGFTGALYPVNPKYPEIQGIKAYPSLEAIPGEVEFALLAVSAEQIPAALTACGERGIKAVLIFSAGFAEIGGEGPAKQAELLAIARRYGIRVIGPNCLGLFNAVTGHAPTFTSGLQGGLPKAGRIGLITQSGAYGSHLLSLAKARRLGVGMWISTGNEADVSVADCLAYMVEAPEIDAIGCYMEGIRNPAAMMRAFERARGLRKPIIVMKVGVSAVGSEAMQSHTASLAGSDACVQAMFDRCGVLRARTTEHLLDVLYAVTVSPPARGDRLGILTLSGGAGVLMADVAEAEGLKVPPMPQATVDRLLVRNPYSSPRNPVDITGHVVNDFSLIAENLEAMITDGDYDLLAAFFTSWTASPILGPKIFETLTTVLSGSDQPLALVGQAADETIDAYRAKGITIFEDPSRALAALGALAGFAKSFATPAEEAPDLPDVGAIALEAAHYTEDEAKAVLARAGIPVLREERVQSPAEAAAAAARLGFPVALKIVSPDIAHKSEVGGVALGLADTAAVGHAAETMLKTVAQRAPGARIAGLLVSPMAGDGVELIVGTRRDPVMGAAVVVGIGGIFAEVMQDVQVALAPVTPARARAMLEALRGAALLHGVRGRPPVDIDAVADTVSRLSVLAAANAGRIDSIEINPLLARAHGVVALDALILPGAAA